MVAGLIIGIAGLAVGVGGLLYGIIKDHRSSAEIRRLQGVIEKLVAAVEELSYKVRNPEKTVTPEIQEEFTNYAKVASSTIVTGDVPPAGTFVTTGETPALGFYIKEDYQRKDFRPFWVKSKGGLIIGQETKDVQDNPSPDDEHNDGFSVTKKSE